MVYDVESLGSHSRWGGACYWQIHQVYSQVRIRPWVSLQVRGKSGGRRLQRKENPGNRSWASSLPSSTDPSSTYTHSLCNGLALPSGL